MSDLVGIVGLGRVGLVTAACLARGNPVLGWDVDPARVEDVRNRHSPFHEEGLAKQMADVGDQLHATDDPAHLSKAKLVILCVPTPPREDGSADLSFIRQAVGSLAPLLPANATLVVRSTVPPGSGAEVEQWLRSAGRADVGVVSAPEFLAEGTAVRDLLQAPRLVVGGADPFRQRVVDAFLRATTPQEVVCTSRETAELSKYAANTFLAARVSLINEFSRLCSATGADVMDLARIVGLDPRVGSSFLQAGLGYGGSCFPKDLPAVVAVGEAQGAPMTITRSIHQVNQEQVPWALGRVRALAPDAHRVAVWGLSFKPATDDVREAPALRLIHALVQTGASVTCHDPQATPDLPAGCRQVDDPLHAVEGADLLIHATEWPQYRALDPADAVSRMAHPRVFDGRNVLDRDAWTRAGATIEGIGRARREPA